MSISTLFENDVKLINELMFLLSREQFSLIDMDIDAIENLLDEKSTLLQKINASVLVRYQALSNAGYEPNENGMAAWIESSVPMKYIQLWQDFQNTLAQAKELNRVNGQLINKHFNRNQQFLNELKGDFANNGVYGPNGQTSSQSYKRPSLSV
jgi:flagellar biosynthesis protein FlgN